jgi:hypothetical protein
MKVEIDCETADRITVCSLKSSIDILKSHIAELRGYDNLKDYQKIDLADAIEDLKHLKATYRYYGGE